MSKRELKKKKRTKIIWDVNNSDWDNFPLVILTKALEKEEWFIKNKCEIEFFRSVPRKWKKISLKEAEEQYKKDKNVYMATIFICQKYRSKKLEVRVDWIPTEARCSIRAPFPAKTTKSRYVEGVIERVSRALDICRLRADNQIAAEEKAELEELKQKEYYKYLCEKIGVDLDPYPVSYTYTYRQGSLYSLRFHKSYNRRDNSKEIFEISNIRGTFTVDEIKQIIKFVGGCPSAVASHLSSR